MRDLQLCSVPQLDAQLAAMKEEMASFAAQLHASISDIEAVKDEISALEGPM